MTNMIYANLKQTCSDCNGRGHFIPLYNNPMATIVQCPACRGKGRVTVRVKVADDYNKKRDKAISGT